MSILDVHLDRQWKIDFLDKTIGTHTLPYGNKLLIRIFKFEFPTDWVEINWASNSVGFCLHIVLSSKGTKIIDASWRRKKQPFPPIKVHKHARSILAYIFLAYKMCTYIQRCADSRKEDVADKGWQGWPWRSWRSLIRIHTSVVRGWTGDKTQGRGFVSNFRGLLCLNKHHFHPYNSGHHFQDPFQKRIQILSNMLHFSTIQV